MLASPGNLSQDRKKVSEIVSNINFDSGQREGFVAEIVTWETHTRPAAGEYPQAVINDQFPDDIDIFIGMMGSYFGTPTKDWGSGTEEEFQISYKRWQKTQTPEIMFYFSDAMSSVSQIDPEQLSKRNSFRDNLKNLGVYYFSYTDVTEFQFDLFRHISDAIRKVLKGKEIGQSKEAIPEESAISLKNYNELLAQDALINAVLMLDSAADHLSVYAKIQDALTADILKLSNVLIKETRNIERAKRNGKQQKIEKTLDSIYNGMSDYSKKLVIKIPKLSIEFSSSMMQSLRFFQTVKDNHLEETMPLTGISPHIGELRKSLEGLIAVIEDVESGFADFPEELLNIDIQKRVIISLHKDLISSLRKSIELLDRLTEMSTGYYLRVLYPRTDGER